MGFANHRLTVEVESPLTPEGRITGIWLFTPEGDLDRNIRLVELHEREHHESRIVRHRILELGVRGSDTVSLQAVRKLLKARNEKGLAEFNVIVISAAFSAEIEVETSTHVVATCVHPLDKVSLDKRRHYFERL